MRMVRAVPASWFFDTVYRKVAPRSPAIKMSLHSTGMLASLLLPANVCILLCLITGLFMAIYRIYYSLSLTRFSLLLNLLISVQPPGCTRSSSLITIARPPSSSSLKITNRSFRYASPSPWNNLPASFRQPRSSSVTTITPSITSSLFHSRLKTHLFHKSFPP